VLVVGQARVQMEIFRHGIQMKCAKESTKEAACVDARHLLATIEQHKSHNLLELKQDFPTFILFLFCFVWFGFSRFSFEVNPNEFSCLLKCFFSFSPTVRDKKLQFGEFVFARHAIEWISIKGAPYLFF